MKEEKQDKPKAPRGPQPTVEEREIRAVLVAVIRDSQNPATAMESLGDSHPNHQAPSFSQDENCRDI